MNAHDTLRLERNAELLRIAGLPESEIASLIRPVEQWPNTPRARALFDRIHSGDLTARLSIRPAGDDRMEWHGEPVREAQAIMDAHVAKLFGCDVIEASRRGQWPEYKAVYLAQPSVQSVLAGMFGEPRDAGDHPVIEAACWADLAERMGRAA
jgi:hypothetical protein